MSAERIDEIFKDLLDLYKLEKDKVKKLIKFKKNLLFDAKKLEAETRKTEHNHKIIMEYEIAVKAYNFFENAKMPVLLEKIEEKYLIKSETDGKTNLTFFSKKNVENKNLNE